MQLAFTTVDEFHGLLEQAGEALDYREVWPRLFPVANCPPELMRKLVADIVEGDERFAWESDVHVGLAAWRAQRRDLADVAFTVVDIETTGATPGFCKITEIGAVRIEGGREVGTFSALVNPGMPIPTFITGITGIDDDTVTGAPPIEVVLPKFVDFAAHSVLVAHNAPFDLGFLDYELGRQRGQTFPRPALDTLRMARKLCPQQKCSLSALAYRFDTRVKPVHRALHDAQATGELLLLFLSWLQEQGMSTLEEVARFCEPGTRRNYHKISLTEKVPTSPGVYIMRDAKGAALYVGKAENLRRRTRDHFLQRQAFHARQALELLERIDVVETGSEFGALLLEGRLIGKHRPPYNSHGTRAGSYHYVKLSAEEYPRLYATPNLRDDGSYYAGPFRKAALARRFVETHQRRLPAAHLRPPAQGRARARLPARRHRRLPLAVQAAAQRRVRGGRRRGAPRARGPRRRARRAPGRAPAGAGASSWRSSRPRACRTSARRSSACCARCAACAPPSATTSCSCTPRTAAAGSRSGGCAAAASPWSARWAAARSARRPRAAFVAELRAAEPPRPPLPAAAVDELLLVHSWVEAHRAAPGVVDLRAFLAGGEDAASAAARLLAAVRLAAAEPERRPGTSRAPDGPTT